MLWHLEIHPAHGYPDQVGKRLSVEAAESGIPGPWTIAASRGFLVEGTLRQEDIDRAARQVQALSSRHPGVHPSLDRILEIRHAASDMLALYA